MEPDILAESGRTGFVRLFFVFWFFVCFFFLFFVVFFCCCCCFLMCLNFSFILILTNLDELSFLIVLAFPNASKIGLACNN